MIDCSDSDTLPTITPSGSTNPHIRHMHSLVLYVLSGPEPDIKALDEHLKYIAQIYDSNTSIVGTSRKLCKYLATAYAGVK